VRLYCTVTIGLTRWEWRVLRASARAWRDKDVIGHLEQLLRERLEAIADDPVAEFEQPFAVPRKPVTLGNIARGYYPGEARGGNVDPGFWHPIRLGGRARRIG